MTSPAAGPDAGRARGLLAVAVLLSGFACAPPPPPVPTLHDALALHGGPRVRTKAFLAVALAGPGGERGRAWLLVGSFACDAGSPLAAARAFSRAGLSEAGLRRMAARRVEEGLAATSAAAQDWLAASSGGWLLPEDATRLRLRGAERASVAGDRTGARDCLSGQTFTRFDDLRRAAIVLARSDDPMAPTARWLALDFPADLAAVFPGVAAETWTRSFSTAEWARHAQGWLDANRPDDALRAAARGGPAAALIAARAALRLRQPAVALGHALRAGDHNPDALVERAEALRQLAWVAEPGLRRVRFAEVIRVTDQALILAARDAPVAARARLLAAEALVETGQFSLAAPLLADPAAAQLPHWEWVTHRWFALQAGRPLSSADPTAKGTLGGSRIRRLAAYWRAEGAAARGNRAELVALAEAGPPDLVAQWAARRAPAAKTAITFATAPPDVPGPPAWANDLLAAGRTADVILAWRAALEAKPGPDRGWLGVHALARPEPLTAIGWLIRGEPRLLAGPWNELPRVLIEAYLPLLHRAELATAAQRAGVPPWLLAGLVRQESAWNSQARSPAGALGLAQILPAVGAEAGPRIGVRISSPAKLFDPGTNLTVGAWLLAEWKRSLGGQWTPAIAAYNAGERRVRAIWEKAGRRDGPEFVEALELPETWDYVHRVVFLAEGYRLLYWPEGKPYPWT